jgi:hypothetical protein
MYLEIPCSIQLSYERKCTGLKDGKVNLGWRQVNRRSRRARHALLAVKTVNHGTERSRRTQRQRKCHAKTQRRKGSKQMRTQTGRPEATTNSAFYSLIVFLRPKKPSVEPLNGRYRGKQRSPLPLLAPVQNPSSLCVLASLREIFLSLWPL